MNAQKSTAGRSTASVAASRLPVAVLVLVCSVVGFSAAAGAATPPGAVPSIIVKYDPGSLTTDEGVRRVYRHLLKAAEEVCPGVTTGSLLASAPVLQCRQQAVARAVHQINDPRLAALVERSAKTG